MEVKKMAKINNVQLTRVNMNLPSKLVERIKEYAASLGLPLTQAYTVLLNQALEQKDVIAQLPDVLNGIALLQKINSDASDSNK